MPMHRSNDLSWHQASRCPKPAAIPSHWRTRRMHWTSFWARRRRRCRRKRTRWPRTRHRSVHRITFLRDSLPVIFCNEPPATMTSSWLSMYWIMSTCRRATLGSLKIPILRLRAAHLLIWLPQTRDRCLARVCRGREQLRRAPPRPCSLRDISGQISSLLWLMIKLEKQKWSPTVSSKRLSISWGRMAAPTPQATPSSRDSASTFAQIK